MFLILYLLQIAIIIIKQTLVNLLIMTYYCDNCLVGKEAQRLRKTKRIEDATKVSYWDRTGKEAHRNVILVHGNDFELDVRHARVKVKTLVVNQTYQHVRPSEGRFGDDPEPIGHPRVFGPHHQHVPTVVAQVLVVDNYVKARQRGSYTCGGENGYDVISLLVVAFVVRAGTERRTVTFSGLIKILWS